jgi:HD superfamily phosphohydrolase
MTENVMHGLGATLTHEDVGAALVIGRLGDAMAGLESEGVGARVVAAMLTHTPVPGDAVAACAQALVSSDLDVDRLDYLYRDSHYSGGFESLQGHLNLISSAWSPSRHASGLYAELTEEGIVFAERVLLLRRDNYRRIVFEHRHMAATGMFEKAVLAAVEGEGDLAGRVKSLLTHKPDLETDQGVGAIIDAAGPVYGLTDHAALSLVSRGSAISRYLIQRIRRGQLYEQVRTTRWDALHYVAQARLSSLSTPRAAFSFRRDLEASLATEVGVDAHHIVVQIDQLRPPAELLLGTVEGGSMAQRSSLGRFFRDDYYRQYILTLFVDPMLGQQREKLSDLWRKKFVTSELPI